MRRVSLLALLMLTIAGILPAAWACADMVQQHQCCHEGSCDDMQSDSAGGDCCAVAPAPATHVAALAIAERQVQPLTADPEVLALPVGAYRTLQAMQRPPPTALAAHALPRGGQQTYLQTGRLRL